jgi:hypothetical protein
VPAGEAESARHDREKDLGSGSVSRSLAS